VAKFCEVWNVRTELFPKYVRFAWEWEEPVSAKIDNRKVKMGDRLFVTSPTNRGCEVQVVGWNLEHEPICQRIDGQPFEWGGVRRHVLDFPLNCLSYHKPMRSANEIAADMLAITRGGDFGRLKKLTLELAAAMKAEEPHCHDVTFRNCKLKIEP